MAAAQFIATIISQIAPLLMKALVQSWSGTRLRNGLANLINDDELRQAQATAREVDEYLGGG